jgi:hypothetical protein
MLSKVLPLVRTTVVVDILRSMGPSLGMGIPDRDTEVDMEDTRSKVGITSSQLVGKAVEVWELPVLLLWVLAVVCLVVC